MDSLLKNKYDVGVVIGRFQIAELSEAHRNIITSVLETHKQVIVAIGVSPTLGSKNHPLSYTARMKMIQKEFPSVIVTYIMDRPSDEDWSKELDKLIRAIVPIGSVCLYGGRDSFIPKYTGVYPTFEMAIVTTEQGTKIREEIGKEVCDSVDFRKGVIYHSQNQYPKVLPTVDIAVVRKTGKSFEVLMARRKDGDLLQFPGGFVDPSDISLEDAAKRELGEELDIEVDNFAYVCSSLIKDWRYNNTSERIMTTLLKADYVFGSGKPNEKENEFYSSEWVSLNNLNTTEVKPNHKGLFESLLKYYGIKIKKINNKEEEME